MIVLAIDNLRIKQKESRLFNMLLEKRFDLSSSADVTSVYIGSISFFLLIICVIRQVEIDDEQSVQLIDPHSHELKYWSIGRIV